MDFGIAKAATAGSLTQVGAVLGTVAYLSPEQARGDEVDYRSDIYSLGALVYQMLTGRPPFVAETLMEMINKLNNQKPTPPSRLNPKVPRALEEVVMKALAKDPARRQQDANQLAEQLLQSLRGDPSATAAYAAVPVGADEPEPERAVVGAAAPVDRTMVAPQFPTDETEVISPVVREREQSAFPKRAVVGGIIVLALLLLATIAYSSFNNPLVPMTDPSPTPSGRFQPGVGVVPPKATTPPVPTTAPPPPTEPTTQPPEPTTQPPEPTTEPLPEETAPEEEPTAPLQNPVTTVPNEDPSS
jgi:serine/threonine-protein kinase